MTRLSFVVFAVLLAVASACGGVGSDEAFRVVSISDETPAPGAQIELEYDDDGGRSPSWYLSVREGDKWVPAYVLVEGDEENEPTFERVRDEMFFAEAGPLNTGATLSLPPEVSGRVQICNRAREGVCFEVNVGA